MNDRIKRLETWLKARGEKPSFKTLVSDPKPSRSGGVSSHVFGPTTLFTVTTESPDDPRKDLWVVERSMGDFVALRSSLVSRFPGAVLGHLPESRMTDLTKTKEEKSTKQGEILNHFLRFLSRHPFISQDSIFIAFLSTNARFTDTLKSIAPDSEPKKFLFNKMFSNKSIGRRTSIQKGFSVSLPDEPLTAPEWWREAIELSSEPDDPLKLSKDIVTELERIKRKLTDFKAAIRDFREKMKIVGMTCLDLNKVMQAWLAVEYSPEAVSVAAAAAEGGADISMQQPDANNMIMVTMSMPTLLNENATRFQNQGLLHQRLALDSASTLLSAIREEVLVLDALKEEVNAAREAVQKVEDAKLHLARKEKELSILEEQIRMEKGPDNSAQFAYGEDMDPNFERKTRSARKAKEEAISALDACSLVAFSLTRSTLNLELNFFREERIVRCDKFFAEFSKAHSDYSYKSLAIWNIRGIDGIPSSPINYDSSQFALSSSGKSSTKTGSFVSYQPVVDVSEKMIEEDDDDEDSDKEELNGGGKNGGATTYTEEIIQPKEELIEWGPNIPWDEKTPKLVQVAFEFEPEQDDELIANVGDRGDAVPYDTDHQWLYVKLHKQENGTRSGIIPRDFIRIVSITNEKKTITTTSKPMAPVPPPSTSPTDKSSIVAQEALMAKLGEMETLLEESKRENDSLMIQLEERDEYISARDQELEEISLTNAKLLKKIELLQAERDLALQERNNSRDEVRNMRRLSLNETSSSRRRLSEMEPSQKVNTTSAATASSSSTTKKQSPDEAEDDNLPPNWIKGFDKARNRVFYHNTATKESVWKKPKSSEKTSSLNGSKRKQGED